MAMYIVSRRLSGGSAATNQLVGALRCSAYLRSISTAFREERDTFGPILVPSDKSVHFLLRIYV